MKKPAPQSKRLTICKAIVLRKKLSVGLSALAKLLKDDIINEAKDAFEKSWSGWTNNQEKNNNFECWTYQKVFYEKRGLLLFSVFYVMFSF